MGRDPNEQGSDARRKPRKPGNAAGTRNTSFVAFNPTEADRAVISGDDRPLEEAMGVLYSKVLEGHKVTLQYNPEYGTYMALIRQGDVEWEHALTLSHWHQRPERALRGLIYALEYRYPSFPDGAFQRVFDQPDW